MKIHLKGNMDIQWSPVAFSLIEHENGEYENKIKFMSCRSYMCDSLFKLKNPTYESKPLYSFSFNSTKGDTYIGICFGDMEYKKNFLANFKWIKAKEEQARVKKSEILYTQNKNVFIIKGSKFWKDSCWKMMLYTFYLKAAAMGLVEYTELKSVKNYWPEGDYWKALLSLKGDKTKESILLSRIKCRKEIFHPSVYGENNDRGMHHLEGFHSICIGKNPPMAKFLGVD